MRVRTLGAALLACGLAWMVGGPGDPPAARAGDKKQKKAEGKALVVVDGAGKEIRLSTWKFLRGTRRLSWLAPAAKPKGKPEKDDKEPGDEAPAGPEVLELREENSTTFQKGILTLVPLTSLEKIEYDPENQTVKVSYLRAGEKGPETAVLTGSTKFQGINKLTLEGEVDLGELGKAAQKFQGGTAKGIRSLRFPSPQPVPAPAGRPAFVTAKDKQKTQHPVADLQALYGLGRDRARLIPKLMFKTTVKIDLAKLERLRVPEDDKDSGDGYEFEVTLKGGKQLTLTLLTETNPEDGKRALLEGLVGRVAAGYQLFPLHTLLDVQFDKAPPPKKKIDLDADAPGFRAGRGGAVVSAAGSRPGPLGAVGRRF
jgi:hypothetical protein